jgi:hypothetical protein
LFDTKRNRRLSRVFARRGSLTIATVLLSAVLGACGGGGDDGPTGAATVATGVTGANGGNGPAAVSGGRDQPLAEDTPASGGDSLVAVPTAAKGSTTLSWTPPTMYDDGTPLKITGYRIYWGLVEGHYTNSVTLDNPGLTRYVIEQLTPATWYFVATALSADGESPPSNAIAMKVL